MKLGYYDQMADCDDEELSLPIIRYLFLNYDYELIIHNDLILGRVPLNYLIS